MKYGKRVFKAGVRPQALVLPATPHVQDLTPTPPQEIPTDYTTQGLPYNSSLSGGISACIASVIMMK